MILFLILVLDELSVSVLHIKGSNFSEMLEVSPLYILKYCMNHWESAVK